MIFKVSQKPVTSFSFLLNQQAGPILVLLLCTWDLKFASKSCFPLVGGRGWGGWVSALTMVGTLGAELPYGCRWETVGPLCHQEVLPESEVFALLLKAIPTACGLCPETLLPEITKHKRLNLSLCSQCPGHWECHRKDLGLNLLVHHRHLKNLSEPHKGCLSFVDLWKPTEFVTSLI